MRRVGPTPRRGAALVHLLLAASVGAIALTAGHARAELGEGEQAPLGEFELPDWIPSMGVGFGIHARDADGSIEAILRDGTTSAGLDFFCVPDNAFFPGNPAAGSCPFSAAGEETVDGGSIPGDLQLLGPEWSKDLPFGVAIRPLLRAGAAWNFDRRVIGRSGFELPDMESNGQEPDLLMELEAEPRWFWFAGLGTAIRLPFERPTFLKIAGNYHEQRVNVFGRADRGFQVGAIPLEFALRVEDEDELTIRGFGPSIGLETELARFGPVAFGFAADFMVTFPVSGEDTRGILSQEGLLDENKDFTPAEGGPPLCAPGQQPMIAVPGGFCYDNIEWEASLDNPFYFGGVQVRISWIGW